MADWAAGLGRSMRRDRQRAGHQGERSGQLSLRDQGPTRKPGSVSAYRRLATALGVTLDDLVSADEAA
jgi:hypothetical protein